jgi:hypothetical protein
MPALASALRKTLETTVVKARDLAERGAREALTGLAVEAREPFGSMGEEERRLRNRLRARGRQLGDQRDAQKGTQSIERLVREMAYEHWHRMLFARFLAENQLLIEPSSGVAVSLAECEELAAEAGTDLWGLAASYAQGMLPEIFRTDDPVLALRLPLEIRQQLQALVGGVDGEVFSASDSLGWTYQFWQKKRKKEVKRSGVDIGADELPAVTQLFTEDYMVDFLLDNTLGAWHAGKLLAANPQLARTAQTEEALREAVALPGCPWNYLRFIKTDNGPWAPAAGTFQGWPRSAAELHCLDPCMGSGHFMVAMFERLVALRIEEEGMNEKAAVEAVIEDNLFGLEIDPRCTQIAAFNLALAAWRRVGHGILPAMNLACSGLAPNAREADWLAMAGDNEKLQRGMERLYRLFQKAAMLGSLINPSIGEGDLLVAAFHELQPLLEQALAQETSDESAHEMAVTARGLTKAAEILAGQFTLVATNVPFLGYREMGPELLEHVSTFFADEKGDLGYCLWRRFHALLAQGTTSALVTLQHWLSLRSYTELRKQLLTRFELSTIAHLGTGAFETISGEKVNVTLTVATKSSDPMEAHTCLMDVVKCKDPLEKAADLRDGYISVTAQKVQYENPDHRISFGALTDLPILSEYVDCLAGIMNGDSPKFIRNFWELPQKTDLWVFLQSTVSEGTRIGGLENIILFDEEKGHLREEASIRRAKLHNADERGNSAWGKPGVAISQMASLPASRYFGNKYDSNIASVVPKKHEHLSAIWAFCSSESFYAAVRAIDRKLNVTNATFGKVPFDLAHWQKVAAEKYPDGLPKPFSSDPTQWLFNGHPAGSDHPLHVAVARLVGYRWPRQTGSSFPDCPALESDGLDALADGDGIVCLSPVRGEASAVERLRKLLLAAGEDKNVTRPESDLENWLRNSFFGEHCKLFKSRPFIWQIWDGNPHGFSALVNYHKLAAPKGQGRKTLNLLTYTYLGDWIDRQNFDQAQGVDGADNRLVAAQDLQGQLKKILDGEPPYDIFVRWKPLHEQPIGWDPDINDGVLINIRPIFNAQLSKGSMAGAGILRAKPGTIKWIKNRGKEPMRSKDDFPWFWGWDEKNPALATDFGVPIPGAPPAGNSFDGNRWNDLHYTRAAKEAARASHRGEG